MTLMFLGRRQDGGCPSQWADARERVPPVTIADAINCVPPHAVTTSCDPPDAVTCDRCTA